MRLDDFLMLHHARRHHAISGNEAWTARRPTGNDTRVSRLTSTRQARPHVTLARFEPRRRATAHSSIAASSAHLALQAALSPRTMVDTPLPLVQKHSHGRRA